MLLLSLLVLLPPCEPGIHGPPRVQNSERPGPVELMQVAVLDILILMYEKVPPNPTPLSSCVLTVVLGQVPGKIVELALFSSLLLPTIV